MTTLRVGIASSRLGSEGWELVWYLTWNATRERPVGRGSLPMRTRIEGRIVLAVIMVEFRVMVQRSRGVFT